MSVPIPEAYVVKKAKKTEWGLHSWHPDAREVVVELGEPLFGQVPGYITLRANVDVAGPTNQLEGTKAGSDIAFVLKAQGFAELVAAMYAADQEATLKAVARAILDSGEPRSDAELAEEPGD